MTEHERFEELLARAVRAEDPVVELAKILEAQELSEDLRRLLRAVDEDGLRMSALLVARLRFERLMRGSPEAEAWFDADPRAFAQFFRRYHSEVPPTAFFPNEEARLFDRFRST